MICTYGNDLFRLIYGVVKDQAHAEDIVQETLLQICDSLPEYRGQGLKTWMARIAVNKAIDFKRKAFVHREIATDSQQPFETSVEHFRPVELEVLRMERRRSVRQKLDELPAKYREVVYAFYIEGKSYDEIAKEAGLEHKSVESRLYRARKWMQKHWKEDLW